MEDQTIAVDTAPAVSADPAPAQIEEPVIQTQDQEDSIAVSEGSAPAPVEIEEEPKAIRELKSQRKKRQEAEKEAAYWRGIAEASHRGAAPAPVQQSTPVSTEPPRIENFDTYEAYENAKEEYLLNKAEQRILARRQQEEQTLSLSRSQQEFNARIEKAAEDDPEIMDYVRDTTLPINDAMASVIRDSDAAPQLLKYLGNNRNEAQRLFRMNPVLAARELGKIEATILATPKPVPKKVSMAPAPVTPVTPAGSSTVDETQLSIEEFMRRRNEAQYGRGRRA